MRCINIKQLNQWACDKALQDQKQKLKVLLKRKLVETLLEKLKVRFDSDSPIKHNCHAVIEL